MGKDTDQAARQRGRPALSEDGSRQFSMRLPADLVDEIEAIRQREFPRLNRSDMIRHLLDEAVRARRR